MKHRQKPIKLLLLLCLVLFCCFGCARKRVPLDQQELLARAETQCKNAVCVSVASLSESEIETHFGYPLFKDGIIPVWIKIDNKKDNHLWTMPIYADPDYYDPSEIAIKYRHFFSHADENQCLQIIEEEKLDDIIIPHSASSGFIYTERSYGSRVIPIVLLSHQEMHHHVFQLPGYRRFDHDHTSFVLEQDFLTRDFQDLEQLHTVLTEIPPRTSNSKQTKTGDPVNFFLIGKGATVFKSLAMSDWDETESLSFDSALKTVKAFLTGARYVHSPVSSLYLFGRRQDAAFQKVRDSIHARNHLRLWRTPYTFQGIPLWAGQISRDIGIRFTLSTPNLTTHIIDPDVDAARWYLIQDFISSQHIHTIDFVRSSPPVLRDAPEKNLTGDPFFTDGLQAVMFLSDDFTPPTELQIGDWEKNRGVFTQLNHE